MRVGGDKGSGLLLGAYLAAGVRLGGTARGCYIRMEWACLLHLRLGVSVSMSPSHEGSG